MTRKMQTQLIVSRHTWDRANALALVIPDSRAEVIRRALEGRGLKDLERTYESALTKIDPIAERFGMSRTELAGALVERKLTLEQAAGMERFPVEITTP